ncbi:MAG TPA: amino acid permease [Thermoanaerobaculia bacterium]|jgi:amino acid transporter|nr:amino acid permease [Thermoanaerobaculia bacterium]
MTDAKKEREPAEGTLSERVRRTVLGAPRDVTDTSQLHRMSLIAFLAWVGLGADGLSSSAYGPEEAFRTLGEHTYLAIGLAIATALTVLIISASYSSIIEQFPTGGGGYVVASHLLGPRIGVISGCALVVDYVLTITVSIASGGDAVFSFLPHHVHHYKLGSEFVVIGLLIALNLRGVKESIKALLPIFLVFLVTHALLISWSVLGHLPEVPIVAHQVSRGFSSGLTTLGLGGMALLLMRAYALGGGTYTGIEAVSNGLQIMREPRVETGKRTMVYMALSLALTAGGILVGYLLLNAHHVEGKTMNAILAENVFGSWHIDGMPLGYWLVLVTLISEGLLLVVAAQAGFIDGPRVMATMATDSFFPHRFAALSEQLTMQNGVLLMGAAALGMLAYTRGNIQLLVFMYSINVFLTFTLSQLSMCRFWWAKRGEPRRRRHLFIHGIALVMCASILVVTLIERFTHGGWVTVLITSTFVILCYLIQGHYARAKAGLRQLDDVLGSLPTSGEPNRAPLDPKAPTAVLLVSSFNGFGVHTMLSILRFFPGLYKQFVFVSIAVVDSGTFKGKEELEALARHQEEDLAKYVDLARRLGFPADFVTQMGIEVVTEAAQVCRRLAQIYPKATIFTGKLVFRQERFFYRLLHNETSWFIQRRLQWMGVPMVVLPIRSQV